VHWQLVAIDILVADAVGQEPLGQLSRLPHGQYAADHVEYERLSGNGGRLGHNEILGPLPARLREPQYAAPDQGGGRSERVALTMGGRVAPIWASTFWSGSPPPAGTNTT
jgi:hypothetical protein